MSDTENLTIEQVFNNAARRWPQRPFMDVLQETANTYAIEAGEISYQAAQQRIETIADNFRREGYRAGQRVLLLLQNRPDFFLYWLAINRLGMSVVPVNSDLRLNELEFLISHAEPCLAISIDSHLPLLHQAATAVGADMPIIEYSNAIPASTHNNTVAVITDNALNREAAVLYTSGTTGTPKGCVLSNNYFVLAGHWYASTGGLCTISTDEERMITPLPVFHMNAMAYSFMAMVTIGGCLICLDRFHPTTFWHSVRTSRATCLHYLGVMPSMLMNAEPSQDDLAHCVRFGFGAGIDPSLHKGFEARFGFPLVEAWAMTETGAGAVIAANHEPRIVGGSSIGRPSAEIEVRLIDDDNQIIESQSAGELLVRHAGTDPRYGFFTEYYKDPQATESAWRDDWFHTGDIVKRNADGDMVFVDRKKNVIRRSGENIAAVEVESVLMQHPAITAAAVAAVPDKLRGDEVFACLKVNSTQPTEPDTQAELDIKAELAREIVAWCLSRLAYYKVPGYIAFVETLPLTATQKIQRGELKILANELLNDNATICTTAMKKQQTVSN